MSSSQPIICQSKPREFLAELSEFGAELSEFGAGLSEFSRASALETVFCPFLRSQAGKAWDYPALPVTFLMWSGEEDTSGSWSGVLTQ